MVPLPAFVVNTLKRRFMSAKVIGIDRLRPRWKQVVVAGDDLMGVVCKPGQSVQVLVDGSLASRCYTPMRWDTKTGAVQLLIFLHYMGPGADWAHGIQEGEACLIRRPRRAIDVGLSERSVVLFGDETSFATAAALEHGASEGTSNRYVFEVSSIAEAEAVLSQLGVEGFTLIQKRRESSHLGEVLAVLMQTGWERKSSIVLTGRASSIETVRRLARSQGLELPGLKMKAYWAAGKSGLN